MKILVTGSKGFFGRNLIYFLKEAGYKDILEYSRDNSEEELRELTRDCGFVFHLAGVNRPKDPKDFYTGNTLLTEKILKALEDNNNPAKVLLSSSVQAGLDNPYGASKRGAEEAVFSYGKRNEAPVYVYRYVNLFGRWSRPEYNTVIATFCHHIWRDIEIRIDDREKLLSLAYIDDVCGQIIRILETGIVIPPGEFVTFPPALVYERKLGYIADTIREFKETGRDRSDDPDEFVSKLYKTYESFSPEIMAD